jgi:hypothetical protein
VSRTNSRQNKVIRRQAREAKRRRGCTIPCYVAVEEPVNVYPGKRVRAVEWLWTAAERLAFRKGLFPA